MKSTLPYKTFNLFDSYNADVPFTEKLYKWITSVGRYIIVGVEMVVLTAFAARFILDQNLNDYKDKIEKNDKIITQLKPKEIFLNKVFDKITVSKDLVTNYENKFISEISKVFDLAPAEVKIQSISIDESLMTIATIERNSSVSYEDLLKKNILNPNKLPDNTNITIKVTISGIANGVSSNIYKIFRNK